MGGKNDEEFWLENIVHLLTGGFKIQLSTIAFEYMQSTGARPFDIGPFGTWAITGGATPPGSSLVVVGIPEDLDEMEMATSLVMGTECMLPEPVHQCIRELRVHRLKKQVRSDAGAAGDCMPPPGARELQPVSPPEFALSQCCRVFGHLDLINFIIERGYMNLRWPIVPIH